MVKKKSKETAIETQGSGIGVKLAQFREFFEQSRVELKKVTWPTRKETVTTSMAVLVLVMVMAIFLGLVDMGLAKIIEAILN
ncbi:MAG: preprotein translocase subunit SecE [Desulfovibrionales bacterium]